MFNSKLITLFILKNLDSNNFNYLNLIIKNLFPISAKFIFLAERKEIKFQFSIIFVSNSNY